MSLRIVDATGTGTVVPNYVPCEGQWSGQSGMYAQSGVRANETLQIRFSGNPPYNLTQTVCYNDRQNNILYPYCACGVTITNLDSDTFDWTVNSFKYNETGKSPGVNGMRELFAPGMNQSVIWMAIEQNSTSLNTTKYHYSPNFTYSTTSYDNPKSGAGSQYAGPISFGLTGWGVFSLAVLGTLMGM